MTLHACPTPTAPRFYADGNLQTGDIVVADVRNPIENPGSRGKRRPFLLVRRVDGHWQGMGFTTRPSYASGAPRVAIPDPKTVGLTSSGFLWGDRLTSVSVLDIHQVIGQVNPSLAEAVIGLARLSCADAAALRTAARPSANAA